MVAQKSSSEEETVNIRRNMAFIIYGGLYQGIFQEFLFNGIFPRIFGDGTSALTVAKKVMFDMLFISPLICLPFAYIIKALVFQQSFLDGVKKYISDVKNNGLLGKYWLVWCPVQCMTFTIIPTEFRISFIACFSFFWLILLSTISSKNAWSERFWLDDGHDQNATIILAGYDQNSIHSLGAYLTIICMKSRIDVHESIQFNTLWHKYCT